MLNIHSLATFIPNIDFVSRKYSINMLKICIFSTYLTLCQENMLNYVHIYRYFSIK